MTAVAAEVEAVSAWRNPGGAALVRGDACAIPLGDNTVDLIVTSPPYFALRSYQDGGEHYDGQIGSEATPAAFLEALWAVTAECWRVLKPSGSLFLNLGDKYAGSGGHNNASLNAAGNKHAKVARSLMREGDVVDPGKATRRSAPDSYNKASDGVRAKSLMGLPWRYAIGCIDGQADPEGKGWILRSEIVWSKPNGMPESVRDRVRRSHEQWFHFTKEPRYYADMDVVREPHLTDPTGRPTWEERKANGEPMRAGLAGAAAVGNVAGMAGNPLGKLPDSVWTIATEPLIVPEWLGVDHFAAFPTEWPRRIISAWCPPDGIVLDPFGGTGTTAMVARALGRYGISLDLSADYLKLARWRVFDSGHGDKAIARTNADAQGDLFASAAQIAQETPS